jgi:hypothetical protein
MAILQGNFREIIDRLRFQKVESEEADIDQREFQLNSLRKEQTHRHSLAWLTAPHQWA